MVYFSPYANFLLIELSTTFMIKDFNFATLARWDLRGRAWDDPHIVGNSDLNVKRTNTPCVKKMSWMILSLDHS